ncbi:MAG: putative flavoprotein [Rhodobacteraceae bacterium HLUCCA12]|nr:MAG: putative flavoprotein [Rhodobacteraceae bacterium HLUCCA12]
MGLLGLCGSLRRDSHNRKLMMLAAASFGGRFEEGDLRLPLLDVDVQDEIGLPPEVQHLVEQIKVADALLIACPEYNKAPPGLLKNALDWISRAPGHVLEGKPVALVSAAAGRAGGERSQSIMRWMLHPLRAEVLTHPEVLVGHAADAFDADGVLLSERYRKAIDALMARLAQAAQQASR